MEYHMMTREEVLAEMEASFAEMPEDMKTEVLFSDGNTDWTPTLLLEEIRNDTEMGKQYVVAWSDRQDMLRILDSILGPVSPNGMTCGLPGCNHCHGVVRPFNQEPISSIKDLN
jgi:hypothetical protein